MEKAVRESQLKLLKVLAKTARHFALAGGTALELYYLHHRFSRDLDLFSPRYDLKEIDRLVAAFGHALSAPVVLESEFFSADRARVRFYSIKVKSAGTPLKIDFIEDVLIPKPTIRRIREVPVYSAKDIYFQKVIALIGTRPGKDQAGREVTSGRNEPRDVVDLYYLSKKVEPLHLYLKSLSRLQQRGLIQWYQTYSRQETRLGALDLILYDRDFDASEMIRYLDSEVKQFMTEEI